MLRIIRTACRDRKLERHRTLWHRSAPRRSWSPPAAPDLRLRVSINLVRDMYLFKVKLPEESKYKFDYYQILATIPGNEAFRPQEEGGCPLLRKK
jgi:hypothetical protein